MALKSVNPATGEVLATIGEHAPDHVERILASSVVAFRAWRTSSAETRAGVLRRISELLLAEKDACAATMVREMGKTRKSAVAEVEKCALACRYYAEHGPSFIADEAVATEMDSAIRYLPLGVVLAIMPWNFPFWQVFRFLAPALMAGNAALLKHASNVPQCALAIESIVRRAGLPEGVFQVLLIGSARVGEIVRDPRVAAVTLTGSEAAGMQVASEAGRALKKCVLELGGNDPFIVLPSADLDKAVATAVVARMANNGQSCVCAKRFIVHKDVYDQFEREFVRRLAALTVGDPMADATELGPLATPDGVTTLDQQVQASVRAGARLLTGGKRLDGPGNFYAATALGDIPPEAPAYREEVFGPVAMLFKANDLDHAIALANDTPFGLGSSVWTNDPAEQQRCATEIEAGQTFINSMVVSDPRLPFGGIKLSGYGRELGMLGLREFTNIKTVVRARA
jgi:succinate-semialdehyde dehydrogenase/glutarate-semialdehyde dehydrogenase